MEDSIGHSGTSQRQTGKKEDITECVYKVSCANCDKTYVGETGRKLGMRLQQHKTECESKTDKDQTGIHLKSEHCQLSRDQQIHPNRPREPGESHDQVVQGDSD